MPLEFHIDHARRMVFTKGHGTLSDYDFFEYQSEVWSLPEVAGYSELVDMSDVEHTEVRTPSSVRDLATMSAWMDLPQVGSKFAIVAPGELAYGLGRMYEAYRQSNPRSTKQVAVFKTMVEALQWLGIDGEDR
jgi:hypothetical protein